MQMRDRRGSVEESFCWPEYGSALRCLQRGRGVFFRAYLVGLSSVCLFFSAATSFSLPWYARLRHCVLQSVLNAAGAPGDEGWAFLCFYGGDTQCVFVCVCVWSCSFQMPRHPAGLHPASPRLSGVWYVLDVTRTPQPSGPPPDSGRLRMCVRACTHMRVCQAMTRTRLPSESHDAN